MDTLLRLLLPLQAIRFMKLSNTTSCYAEHTQLPVPMLSPIFMLSPITKSQVNFPPNPIQLYIQLNSLFCSSWTQESRPRAIFRSTELQRKQRLGPDVDATLSLEEWVKAPRYALAWGAFGGM